MAGLTLLSCSGGRLVLPAKDSLLIDRADGGHLVVDPPREVWERSELSAEELAHWSFLVSATGRAMIEVLPQLDGGCVNYWEAGNWALNEAAEPVGSKNARDHRRAHQHVIGRSRHAMNPAWKWGEAPMFPPYSDRLAWSRGFGPMTANECGSVLAEIRRRLAAYGMTVAVARRPELVLFDMAGTTVEDRGQVPQAFKHALSSQGITVGDDQITEVRGSSKRDAIRHFIPEGPNRDDRARGAFDAFRARLGELYGAGGVRPIEGARETFDSLRQRGIKVALNTGFDREITTLLTDALGWSEGVVDAIVCGDDVSTGRPAPDLIHRAMRETGVADASAVANVGDTTLDLQAAAAASTGWSVGVTSGAHTGARLSTVPHTHIAPDVSYLPVLFDC